MTVPFVLFNAAVSVDGKLASESRARIRLGSARDRARMDRIRASADAILVGGGTIRAEDPPLQVRSPALRRKRLREGRPEFLAAIALSRSLALPVSGRFFKPGPEPRLVVAPRSAPPARLARLRTVCEVLLVGASTVPPGPLLERLARRGVRRLLVEGGGETFATFLAEGFVDEIHLTVCPLLVGGRTAPTLFDGVGFQAPPLPRLHLARSKREGEEVYLVYRRLPGLPSV